MSSKRKHGARKSVISERRNLGAVCMVCRSPDYTLSDIATQKPMFTCNSCGNSWQYGIGGGIYMKLLIPVSQETSEG